jgi:glycosyltransferase involved in cell wall biosynthesis
MIHIALISPCMGRYGGLEGFVLTLAAGISQIPGFAVEVLFKRAGAFDLHPELEEQIRESGTSVRFCDKASGLLCQVIRHADLVHFQNLSPDMILAARLLGKPLLATIHARSTGRAGLHQKIWHFMQRIVPQRFYVSEFVRKSWEGPNRRPGSHVVHSICKLPDAPAPWEGRRGFGFFSRFIPNKGLEELLPAYAACGLDPEIWPLHLVGAHGGMGASVRRSPADDRCPPPWFCVRR